MSTGKRIRFMREKHGWSQEELAKKVGYTTRATVNKIELDGTDLTQRKIVRFADALGCSPLFLLELLDDDAEVLDEYPENMKSSIQEYQKKVFSKRLSDLVEGTGKTPKEVAADIGLSTPTLVAWCNGKKLPKISKLEKVARYFNLPPSYFFEGIVDEEFEGILDKKVEDIANEFITESSYPMLRILNKYVDDNFTTEEEDEIIKFMDKLIAKRK